ncbi:hypothetical protein ACJX0J_017702 [Zea mays]
MSAPLTALRFIFFFPGYKMFGHVPRKHLEEYSCSGFFNMYILMPNLAENQGFSMLYLCHTIEQEHTSICNVFNVNLWCYLSSAMFFLLSVCMYPKSLSLPGAICELGSTIGAVEEVDINSLNSKEIVSWCQTLFATLIVREMKMKNSMILDEFIKDDDFIPSPAQDKKKLHMSITIISIYPKDYGPASLAIFFLIFLLYVARN